MSIEPPPMTVIQALGWAIVQADIMALDTGCSPPLRLNAKNAALALRELLMETHELDKYPLKKAIALMMTMGDMAQEDNGLSINFQHEHVPSPIYNGPAYETYTVGLLLPSVEKT